MLNGFRFRCYPDAAQAQTLARWAGCQRFIKNAKVSEDPTSKLDASMITACDAAEFRDRRLKKVKPTTVHHDLCTLSAVFEQARLEWLLPLTKEHVRNNFPNSSTIRKSTSNVSPVGPARPLNHGHSCVY
jgi:hypothetical protein